MEQKIRNTKPYLFKKFKTYTPEEILLAGGTTEFGENTGYNIKAVFNIEGRVLSDEDYQQALSKIVK